MEHSPQHISMSSTQPARGLRQERHQARNEFRLLPAREQNCAAPEILRRPECDPNPSVLVCKPLTRGLELASLHINPDPNSTIVRPDQTATSSIQKDCLL